jgi:DNA helicase-2/ATP-dependent DNA helicase PcrA
VYVLNVVDGCIPSDMATGRKEEIEEERRLLYVAMTRAKDQLYLMQPHRFYTGTSRRNGDRHIYAPRTRFIPDDLLPLFERGTSGSLDNVDTLHHPPPTSRVDIAAKLREMWQ